MTTEFRQTTRWAHWTFGLLAAALLVAFGWMLLGGIRLLIPFCLLGSYWLLAAILNRKTIVFSPNGLTITVGPIPVRARLHFDRDEIRCFYVHYVTSGNSDAVEGQPVYMLGVETESGFHTALDGPFQDLQLAREAVQKLAHMVNAGEHERLIPVRARNEAPPAPSLKKLRVLVWTAAFLAALLLGVLWQAAR